MIILTMQRIFFEIEVEGKSCVLNKVLCQYLWVLEKDSKCGPHTICLNCLVIIQSKQLFENMYHLFTLTNICQ